MNKYCFTISDGDRAVLRDLARKYLAAAESIEMEGLKRLWLKHNTFRGERPMVTVETASFAPEIMPPMLVCEGESARGVEQALKIPLVNIEIFKDDTVIEPYFPVYLLPWFKPFNIDIEVDRPQGNGLGHHFKEIVADLKADFHKLGKSSYGVDREAAAGYKDFLRDIFGDILPVKYTGMSFVTGLTRDIVHIMSMENMFLAMCDYPGLFNEMMAALTGDYIEYFQFAEREGLILPTTGSEYVAMATYAFTDELPANAVFSRDVWGHMDSQETVGISREMFAELIFPHYKRIAGEIGLVSYGCCEPVHPFYDNCLSQLDNLRKLSVSPWCDEAFIGERLAGKKTAFHRKPSPNFIGVGAILDEDAVRQSVRKTVSSAKGCTIEFTQRDVYSINRDLEKAARYVEIIRQESADAY